MLRYLSRSLAVDKTGVVTDTFDGDGVRWVTAWSSSTAERWSVGLRVSAGTKFEIGDIVRFSDTKGGLGRLDLIERPRGNEPISTVGPFDSPKTEGVWFRVRGLVFSGEPKQDHELEKLEDSEDFPAPTSEINLSAGVQTAIQMH
jgi:hypothetical protein